MNYLSPQESHCPIPPRLQTRFLQSASADPSAPTLRTTFEHRQLPQRTAQRGEGGSPFPTVPPSHAIAPVGLARMRHESSADTPRCPRCQSSYRPISPRGMYVKYLTYVDGLLVPPTAHAENQRDPILVGIVARSTQG